MDFISNAMWFSSIGIESNLLFLLTNNSSSLLKFKIHKSFVNCLFIQLLFQLLDTNEGRLGTIYDIFQDLIY